jgi:membrane protease YdiL (CAAX protease family)
MQNPYLLLLVTVGALYVAWIWLGDRRAWRAGKPNPNAFPGATDASRNLVLLGVVGSIVLVALETAGEYALGILDDQTVMGVPFALYAMLGAPVIEELVFRGYLVYTKGSRVQMWGAAVGLSLVFALLHPHLWAWNQEIEGWWKLELHLTLKAAFSTTALFVGSLWFYWLRLTARNTHGSLYPAWAAHTAKNVAVVAIKAVTGHLALVPPAT